MAAPFSTQYYPQSKTVNTNSIDSSHIANGSIVTVDISNEAITEAKLSQALKTTLLEVDNRLSNLENPGWYGTFTIKNSDQSDAVTFTFTVQARTYNPVTAETEVSSLLASTALTNNQQTVITLPLYQRLINKDTILRISYTIDNGDVSDTDLTGLTIEDAPGGIFDLKVTPAFIHNGNVSFEITLVV